MDALRWMRCDGRDATQCTAMRCDARDAIAMLRCDAMQRQASGARTPSLSRVHRELERTRARRSMVIESPEARPSSFASASDPEAEGRKPVVELWGVWAGAPASNSSERLAAVQVAAGNRRPVVGDLVLRPRGCPRRRHAPQPRALVDARRGVGVREPAGRSGQRDASRACAAPRGLLTRTSSFALTAGTPLPRLVRAAPA